LGRLPRFAFNGLSDDDASGHSGEFTASPLVQIAEPFDDPAFVFETQVRRVRALAFLADGAVELVSPNGHPSSRSSPASELL
jgi:hypothetical protein